MNFEIDQKYTPYVGLAALVLLVLGALFLSGYKFGKDSGLPDSSGWRIYRNEGFEFEIKYPDGWRVAEFPNDPAAPRFNIYKIGSNRKDPPFDHFADATHVSVYPRGVPSEGVFSLNHPTEAETKESLKIGFDFTLESGETWGTYLNFENYPSSWDAPGFLWAKAAVSGESFKCFRGEEATPYEMCDPFTGDQVVVDGSISGKDRKTEEEMIKTFRFVKEYEEEVKRLENMIRLDFPKPESVITSPLSVSGEARGAWYFEASFPVILVDWDGRIVAEHYAEAEGEWMTKEFVPFKSRLQFENPAKSGDPDFMRRGALILRKDNPSGLPENDDALEIPVRFE